MNKILFLNHQTTDLKDFFIEKQNDSSSRINPIDTFQDPSKLLLECKLKRVLDVEPFNNIRTVGRVWEFYLLRFVKNINRNQYKKLIKPVPANQSAIKGCSRMKLGNPYDSWINNYQKINNTKLRNKTIGFAKKLVSRKCAIRMQKGGKNFYLMRKKAAKEFFNYLIGVKISKTLFEKLRLCDNYEDRLYLLIKNNPESKLFITSGIMLCLYGKKKVDWVKPKLAKIVYRSLNHKQFKGNDVVTTLKNILISKRIYNFKPPFNTIYDIKGANRKRVNINFRIQTWLKLMEDTLRDSK